MALLLGALTALGAAARAAENRWQDASAQKRKRHIYPIWRRGLRRGYAVL
jgi:hypothetical protein